MPIVTIQCVEIGSTEEVSKATLQKLADQLGDIFKSDPASTWVKISGLDGSCYAENRTSLDPAVQPTFVEVLKRTLQSEEILADEAAEISRCVSVTLGRPRENVHVIYLPEGSGRVAFGGVLLRSDMMGGDG